MLVELELELAELELELELVERVWNQMVVTADLWRLWRPVCWSQAHSACERV